MRKYYGVKEIELIPTIETIVDAIIIGSYSDLYGGRDSKTFSVLLLTENPHTCSWYYDTQFILLNDDRLEGELLIQEQKEKQ